MKQRHFYLDFDNIYFTKSLKIKVLFRSIIITIVFSAAFGYLGGWYLYKTFQTPQHKQLKKRIQDYQFKYLILQQEIQKLSEQLSFLEDIDNNTYRTIYELSIVPNDLRMAGTGGSEETCKPFSDNVEVACQVNSSIDHLLRKIEIQEKSFDELKFFAVSKEKFLSSLPIIMPVDKSKIRITSLFGWRKNPFNKHILSFHYGVDFAGDIGTPVYATGDGIVSSETGYRPGYGLTVVIDHGFGYQTIYAHLSKILVSQGQQVKRGQIIGKIGRSGSTTGPHLHYEIIRNGQRVNPMHFIMQNLTTEEYRQILDLQN